MLNQTRLSRILEKINTDCLLITDPLSIAYLCEKKIEPGERFLGLLIGKEISPVLVLNRLFRFAKKSVLKQSTIRIQIRLQMY